jgi:hypothetical protein
MNPRLVTLIALSQMLEVDVGDLLLKPPSAAERLIPALSGSSVREPPCLSVVDVTMWAWDQQP